MSDESPTRRLSQIFGSLTCLADLKKSLDQQQNPPPPNGHEPYAGNQHHPPPCYRNSTASSSVSPTPSHKSMPSGPSPRQSSQFNSAAVPMSVVRSGAAMGSRSTPNSPRLMPKRSRAPPSVPQRPNAAIIANPSLVALDAEAPWPHFSSLTDHLDVHQINNYGQGLPEINWQERCLELQLELHRSKSQAGRIRDMLRDKVRSQH